MARLRRRALYPRCGSLLARGALRAGLRSARHSGTAAVRCRVVPALAEFRDQLRQCRSVKTHYYHPVADRCPWCRLESEYPSGFPERLVPGPRKLQPLPTGGLQPIRPELPVQGTACFLFVLLSLRAGFLAIGLRPSAIAPFRATGESAAEATKRTVLELGNDSRWRLRGRRSSVVANIENDGTHRGTGRAQADQIPPPK